MKGMGLLTTPAAQQARPNQGENTRTGDILSSLAGPRIGVSGTGSFLSALNQAKTPERGPAEPHAHIQRSERPDTRPEQTSRPVDERRPDERPQERTQEKSDRREPEGRAEKPQASDRPRDEKRTDDKRDERGEKEVARTDKAEDAKTTKSKKDTESENDRSDQSERKVAVEESNSEKRTTADLWDKLTRSMDELTAAHQAGEKQASKKTLAAEAGAKGKQAQPEGKSSEAKTIAHQAGEKDAVILKEVRTEKAETAANEAGARGKSDKSEIGRAEQTARQVYGFAREGAPDKNTEQMLLDPAKWSIHGRQGAHTETVREGEAAREGKAARNNATGLRFDPVKASESDTSGREGSGHQQGQMSGEREFSFLKQDLTTRLMEDSQARQTALRESRELFNSLVQKARVNLGPEGKSSTATIRLKPEFLGNMTLNLKVNGNQVEAVLLVDNQTARKLLTDELEHMRQELRLHGIQVESFSIRVRESGMAFMDAGTDENRTGDQNGQGPASRDRDGDADQATFEREANGNEETLSGGMEESAEYEAHLSANDGGQHGRVDLAI